MDIKEVYLRFKQKINKNYTNDEVASSKSRFVYIFNEVQNNYLEWMLDNKSVDDREYIQKFLTLDKALDSSDNLLNHSDFKLPENYFFHSNLQVEASSGGCTDFLHVHQIKQENLNEYFHDNFNEPSFLYRETFYTIGEDSINIYKKGFNISNAYLTYYRYPRQVDIERYLGEEGLQSSSNINPEWDDKSVNRILTAAAALFNQNNEDFQHLQFDKSRIFNKI